MKTSVIKIKLYLHHCSVFTLKYFWNLQEIHQVSEFELFRNGVRYLQLCTYYSNELHQLQYYAML